MTMERTIADLVEEVGDLSLVANALRNASRQRNLDLGRVRSLLAPLAQRNGQRRCPGPEPSTSFLVEPAESDGH